MGDCDSFASRALTSDSKGLATGGLGAATIGAGSGGATLWPCAACNPRRSPTMVGTKIRRLTKCSMEYKTILALKFVHSKFFIHSIAHHPVAPNASVTILFYSKVPCDTRRALVSGRLCILYFGSGSRRLSYIYLSTLSAASPEDADSNLFPFLLLVGGFSTKSDANMNFFQTVLQSIENPEHAGSPQDLHGLLNLAQLVPGVQGAE